MTDTRMEVSVSLLLHGTLHNVKLLDHRFRQQKRSGYSSSYLTGWSHSQQAQPLGMIGSW